MFSGKKFGVELSSSKIKFLYLTEKNKLIHSAECEMATELDATDALQEYMSRVKPRPSSVKASIKSKHTILRFWTPPLSVPDRELDKVVRLNLENIFPISIEDYSVDYRVLSKPPHNRIMAAAIPSDLSERIVEVFKRNGLRVSTIDVYQNCISKYTQDLGVTNAALFYFDDYRIYFVFLKDGVPETVRDFPYNDSEGCAAEIRSFLTREALEFHEAYFIGKDSEQIIESMFPNKVDLKRLNGGFEGLYGLLT